jgi:DNA repair exonuclease SbcCD ATPase subunit/DNA repair exonuclease SbcCD nuclease subunit
MRFAHIADTHIRNLKYHKEYRAVFSKLFDKLKEEKPDYIIHCGDIAHTKTQISPEFVDMCTNFLKGMADIAPTYVILGNHDGNLKNSSRQDALSPIAKALNHSNLYLLKDSGEVILNDDFAINVLSVFDRDNWQSPSSADRINIALYHGSVSGVKTDTGWVMEHGESDVSIFNNFDYGFLGDIHKTNQALDEDGKIRYPGSTVQQNHGETNDKGFLLWDILSKDEYACEHYVLKNPKPFITVKLTPKGRLPNKVSIPAGARLRLISENNLPLDVVRRAVDIAKSRFKPEVVTYLSRSAGERGSVENSVNGLIQEDLRDIAVQERLIAEYLEDYQPAEETMKMVLDTNIRYNTKVEEHEDVRRNINWSLRKLEWDNLFNYGESNSIDFSKLNGIVGILGKNFSGKSSIIDSLLYTLYNTTSKKERKNLNIINQNEDWCRGYAEINIGTKTYKVERQSKKYKKKLKGKETEEAKTDLNFWCIDNATGDETSLNGITRMATDKNIRKIFGTLEDFLTTSMASQMDSLSYLNEGSTRRKEILAKFLDLEIFEKKFKLAKENSADLSGAIKRLSSRDYDEEITESTTGLSRVQVELMNKERLQSDSESSISTLQKSIDSINSQITDMPEEIVDIEKVLEKLNKIKQQSSVIKTNMLKKQEVLSSEDSLLQKIENFLDNFNIEDVNSKKQIATEYQERLRSIEKEVEEHELRKKTIERKTDFLKSAPCSYKLQDKCQFVMDARNTLGDTSRVKIAYNQISLNKKVLAKKLEELNVAKLDSHAEKYYKLQEKKITQKDLVSKLQLDIEKDKVKLMKADNILSTLEEKERVYEQNCELISNFNKMKNEKTILLKEMSKAKTEASLIKEQLVTLYTSVGRQEQKNTELKEQKKQLQEMRDEFTSSDLFMRCMHANGISYDIIKKRLPVINDEVSKILTNIVDFEVLFESDDKKLDILIKHPKHGARPIEMGSGAEKTIAAMAIRLALLNVSTLPKGDVFILDEPGTALDADNMEGFIRILDMIKTQFKTVLLISHLDSLKDIVDSQILIEKNEGKAYVSE